MGGTNPFCDRRHTRKRQPRVLLIILCKINQSLLLALVVSWSFVINHAGARQLCVAAFRFGRGGRSANPSDNTQPQCTQTSPAKPVTTSTTKRSLLSFLFGTGSVKDDEGELNASSKNLYSSVLIEPDMKSGEFPRYHPGRSDRQQANGAHVSYSQTLDSISNLRETAVSAQFNSADSKEERSEIDFSSNESSKDLVETVKKHSILHTFTIPNHIHNLHQQAMRIASKNSEINETIPSSHTSSYNVSSKLSKLPQVLYGLNISNKKFFSWVQYTLEHDFKLSRSTIESELSKYKYSHMSTRQLDLENATLRDWMRTQWKSRLLVSERTEPLAVYESDTNACNKDLNASGDRSRLARLTTLSPEEPQGFDSLQNEASKKRRKRGGFRDLLSLYADRLLGIIVDEMDGAGIIKDDPPSVPFLKNHVHDVKLFAWLENHFGVIQVARLKGGRFGFFWPYMNENDQLGELQQFLDWFRENFPYYYDRCDYCGASERDAAPDLVPENHNNSPETAKQSSCQNGLDSLFGSDRHEKCLDMDENDQKDDGSFLGYVYPTATELCGKASRTELYLCRCCGNFTRFPRFNGASTVLKTKRGRCGEYSMLLYRMLRALGHEVRWIVDWADHVWCEVKICTGRWVHLDPCEAAVDKPLLYQDWGKTQTYILAYYAPPLEDLLLQSTTKKVISGLIPKKKSDLKSPLSSQTMPSTALRYESGPVLKNQGSKSNSSPVQSDVDMIDGLVPSRLCCVIEDVTLKYTSESLETVQMRREESFHEIDKHIIEVSTVLQSKIDELIL